jgi:hypothetical protein
MVSGDDDQVEAICDIQDPIILGQGVMQVRNDKTPHFSTSRPGLRYLPDFIKYPDAPEIAAKVQRLASPKPLPATDSYVSDNFASPWF